MELPQLITTFPLILTFLIFFFFLLKQLKKSKIPNKSSLLLPPGPSKLPFIGHLHHLLGLLHHSLRNLAKKHGPLMYLQLGELSTVVVSSPAIAKEMMKTHDLTFADRPNMLAGKIISYGGSNVALAPDGELWRQLRKVCVLELLSAKRVKSLWSVREEEVLNLIKSISLVAGSSINLSVKLFTLSNDTTARASFGKTCKEKQAFISVTKQVLMLSSGFAISDLFPSMKFLGAIIIGTIIQSMQVISVPLVSHSTSKSSINFEYPSL